MSDDASKNLKVNIKLTSNPEVADKTAASLKKVTDVAHDGNDMAAASGKLTNELSDKTKAYVKTLEGATEGHEKFHLSGRKAAEMARELIGRNEQLGAVLREIKNPWEMLVFALTAVVSKMVEYENQMREMEDRPGPDWETDTQKLNDLRKGYDEAALAANKFAREMDELTNKERTPQEKTDAKIEKLKELAHSEEELLQKQHERDQAGIEAAEQMGLISHATAIAAKLQLDQQYAQQRIALEAQMQQAEIAARQQELEADKMSEHISRSQLPGAQTGARTAHAAEKSNADRTTNAQTNLDKALEERKKSQEDVADLQRTEQNGDPATFGLWALKKLGANVQTPEDARKLLEDRASANEGSISLLQQEVKKGQTAAPGLEDAAAAADEKLESIKEKMKAFQTRINELEALIPQQQSSANLRTRTELEGARIDAGTADLHALPALAQAAGGNHDQLLQGVNTVIATMNSNQGKTNAAMAGHQAVAQQHSDAIDRIVRQIEVLHQRQSNTNANVAHPSY
jgi:chromosome segregation ATPase